MKTYIDLTYEITPNIPMWPGEPSPELWVEKTVPRDGYSVQGVRLTNHLGTHLDTPSHLIEDGATLDQIPLEVLIGRALVLDLTHKEEGDRITRRDLEAEDATRLRGARILLKTAWDLKFRKGHFFEGFPCLDLEAARYLATLKPLLLGMDTPSPSPVGDPGERIHKTLLGAGILHLEALKNLHRIPGNTCDLFVLPLPFKGFSGGPCRVVAVVDP